MICYLGPGKVACASTLAPVHLFLELFYWADVGCCMQYSRTFSLSTESPNGLAQIQIELVVASCMFFQRTFHIDQLDYQKEHCENGNCTKTTKSVEAQQSKPSALLAGDGEELVFEFTSVITTVMNHPYKGKVWGTFPHTPVSTNPPLEIFCSSTSVAFNWCSGLMTLVKH